METISLQVQKMEEDQKILKEKAEKMEELISKLKLEIKYEKFKNFIFSKLLEQISEIKISDLIKEEDGEIHIHNFEKGNIDVIVEGFFTKKKYSIEKDQPRKSGVRKTFRKVKNSELTEEDPVLQEEKIKQAEKEFTVFVQENKLDVSPENVMADIEKFSEEIAKIKVYKQNLLSIKENRSKLLGKLNLSEYVKFLKSNCAKLESIFTTKKYNQKKIITAISSSLSSLDQRLIFYGKYFDSPIEADEIQKLKICITVSMDYPKKYIPCLLSENLQKLSNYSLCLMGIKEILKIIIVNPYGFYNLIYLEKPVKEDLYSFYILEKVENNKRYWKMECRLEELSKIVSAQMKKSCIYLFRKIYFDIFNDNVYREDWNSSVPATQQDCEQLLMNIITLSKQRYFCDMMRDIVSENCKLKPSENDKFNTQKDDILVKKNFMQEIDDTQELNLTIQKLFDKISVDDCEKLLKNKID